MPELTNSVLVNLMSRADAGSAEQWIHVLPIGTIKTRDGRGPYKLTNPTAVINASRENAGRRKMPVDYDHAIDLAAPRGDPAPAAGWIDALQSRVDGIWGRVDWTPRAAEQLAHREYRYLSPVISHTSDGTVTGILRASLTNNPNFDQLTALASMETTPMDKLPELRTMLGLPADATIDDILAKIKALTAEDVNEPPPAAHAAHDPSKFVPIGDFERVVAQVNTLNQGISLQAATGHVEDQIRNGNLLPYLKDWGISLCSVNKPAFDAFVSKTRKGLAFLRSEVVPSAYRDGRGGNDSLSQDEIAIASNLGVTADAFLKTKTARGTVA
jgi:phage I-like protein